MVTTMSDNQFRTLALLERSFFGLRPQRLLSDNAVFFTNYLIQRLAALQILLATSTVKTNNYVIIPEDDAKLNDQASCLRGWNPGLAGFN